MGGLSMFRTALIATTALAASAMGVAMAQDALAPGAVDFNDPAAALSQPETPAVALDVRDELRPRFAAPALTPDVGAEPRRLELAVAAGGENSPLDISIAQRASLGSDSNGDLDRSGQGSEVRIGRGLVEQRQGGDGRSVYMFVASDNEALTWQPGARSEFGGAGSAVAMQDRVEVGDMSAGVTYERNGVQASLAYVEREETTRVGNQNFNQDQSFTGVTVTMRR